MRINRTVAKCIDCTLAQLWNPSRDCTDRLNRLRVFGSYYPAEYKAVPYSTTQPMCYRSGYVHRYISLRSSFSSTFCLREKQSSSVISSRSTLSSIWCAYSRTSHCLFNHHIQRKSFSSGKNDDSTNVEESPSSEANIKEWKKDSVLTVPNALTVTRIVLSPVLGYMVLNGSYMYACGIFAFAGITDVLDGFIARRYPSQSSAIGSFIDPLADKFLVSILFISLTAVDLIPVALTSLVITRDILLVGAAFCIRYITLPPPKTFGRYFDVTHATAQLHPTFISKLNTAVQLCLVAATLCAPVFGYVDHAALHLLWYLTAATTVSSGITYVFAKDTFKIIRETKKQKK